jgi:hypothetical protein
MVLRTDEAGLAATPVYMLLVFLPGVLTQMAFTEDPDASWLLRALPADPSALRAGAVKAMVLVFVVLPGAFLVVVSAGMHGLAGLMQGILALELALLVAALGATLLPRRLPFAEAFRVTSAGTSVPLVAVSMLVALVCALVHMALWEWARPVFLAAAVLLLPTPILWARLVERLRVAVPSP